MMQNLRDIKGLIDIQDYSLYVVVFLLILLFLIFAYFIKRFLLKKKRVSQKKIAQKRLKQIDIKDAKKCAYVLSEILPQIIEDKNEYEELLEALQKYKYKKQVDKLSEDETAKIDTIKEKYSV